MGRRLGGNRVKYLQLTPGYDRTNERWRRVEWQRRRTSSWAWSRARGTGGGRLRTCRGSLSSQSGSTGRGKRTGKKELRGGRSTANTGTSENAAFRELSLSLSGSQALSVTCETRSYITNLIR